MVHRVAQFAFVDDTIGIGSDPAPSDVAIQPVAFKRAAIGERNLARAGRFSGNKCALIDRPIGETGRTGAANFAGNPVTDVFISVGEAVRALPMLFAI